MSSINKTTHLKLNKWEDTDKPKRTDFVSDNMIIDTALGEHIENATLHLTDSEKARVSSPYEIITVYGDGNSTNEITLDFTPQLVIYFKKNKPFNTVEGNYLKVNSAVGTATGVMAGLQISGNKVTVCESSTSENGILYNLNENNGEYVLIAFR